MGYIAVIKKALKQVRTKLANKLVEIAIGKSKWKHLVDPSERKDDLQHQDTFHKITRQLTDDFGMTHKQAEEFASYSIKLPEAERFEDVDTIIKDFGAYE